MSNRKPVPAALAAEPFTTGDARAAGITRGRLAGAGFRRIMQGVWCAASLPDDPEVTLAAVYRALPHLIAFSGATAAWLHGLALAPCDPVEVTVPEASRVAPRTGLAVVRSHLSPADVVCLRRLPVTSLLRTLTDLGRRADLVEAVVAMDDALHQGLLPVADLHDFVAAHYGRKGMARLRAALAHVEPASESPMETRLRLAIVGAGLPRPVAQLPIHIDGHFIARPDLLYPDHRLVIEYDGGTHRDSLADDNRRQNRLTNAGYRLLRFTATDVYRQPEMIAAHVRAALLARPA